VTPLAKNAPLAATRNWPRYSNLKDLSLTYEGRSEVLRVHPPDISPTGMFINTTADFPEGAILKLNFRLVKSDHPIDVRCEVRYCLAGVGVGVEFIGMSPTDQEAIAREIQTPGLSFKLQRRAPAKKRARRRRKKH
jgi:hypothetical protein